MKNTFFSLILAAACSISSAANAQTTTIEYWSNHGNPPALSISPNSVLPCVSVTVLSNPDRITDASPDNYVQFLTVLEATCKGSIRTSVLPSPATNDVVTTPTAPRYAGYFLETTADIATLLGNVTLRLYDDSALVKTASGGSLLTLLDLGTDRFFVYTDITVNFDDVEIEFGSLATAVSNLRVYYAFATAGIGTFPPISSPPLSILTELGFTANPLTDGTIRLEWTQTPEGCREVAVQRAAGATDAWQTIEALPGGDGSWVDRNAPLGEASHYRLRLLTVDGSFQYSSVQRVWHRARTEGWAVFPNPTDGPVYLNVPAAGVYTISIRDAVGRVVFAREKPIKKGQYNVWPDANGLLKPGLYFLDVAGRDGSRWHTSVLLR